MIDNGYSEHNKLVEQEIARERERIYNELANYSKYDTLQIAKFRLKQIIHNTDKVEY